MNGTEPFLRRGDRFLVSLTDGERTMLVDLARQSRELLESEDPSSDPAVARLFPAAYRDDPLMSLEFERTMGEAPKNGKLEALATLERTAGSEELSEDEFLSWMGAVNDMRLVLGTRIEVGEESTDEDYPEDDPDHVSYVVYRFLTDLEGEMLYALGELDPEGEPPPD